MRAAAHAAALVRDSGGLEEALEAAVPTGKKRKAESQEVGGRAGDAKRPSQRPNKRREMKDKKYGYGGNKRGAKRNDKASTDDMRSFSVHQNSARTFGKVRTRCMCCTRWARH